MTDARTLTGDLLARLERHYIKPGEPYPGGDERVADRLQFEQNRDDAGRLRAQLDAICKALGVTTIDHTGHRRGWLGADYLTITDLADAAAFLRAHRDITVAAEQLRARHHDPIATTRERLDELETALGTLQALTTPTAKETTA